MRMVQCNIIWELWCLTDSKRIKKFIGNKYVIKNTLRIQAYDSMMCGYFLIVFIVCFFLFKRKALTDFTNLFSSNNLERMTK